MNHELINMFKHDFFSLTKKEVKLKSVRYYAALLNISRSQVWSTFETLKKFNVIKKTKPNSNYTMNINNFSKMFGKSEYLKIEEYSHIKAKKINVKTDFVEENNGFKNIIFHREVFLGDNLYSLSLDILYHTKIDRKLINNGFHNLIRENICQNNCLMSIINKVINIKGKVEYKKLKKDLVIFQQTKIVKENTGEVVAFSSSLIPLEFFSESYIKIFS